MLDWREILIRLLLASLFGALIGLERERKNWSAGMRTHMMVCLGSSLIMMVSAFGFSDILKQDHTVLDPSRIAAQVVSGIGFIGAGTILFLKQGVIRGLTTASGLWTVAAIGLATGGGMYIAASLTTFIALIILWALQPIEKRYARRFIRHTLQITTTPESDDIDMINTVLGKNVINIVSFNLEKHAKENVFNITFRNIDPLKMTELIKELKGQNSIKEVFWNKNNK